MNLAKIINWGKYYIKYYPQTKELEVCGKIKVCDFLALKRLVKNNKNLRKRIDYINVV